MRNDRYFSPFKYKKRFKHSPISRLYTNASKYKHYGGSSSPESKYYRVIFKNGIVVRKGSDKTTPIVKTIPKGTIIEVKEKKYENATLRGKINNDYGYDGWITIDEKFVKNEPVENAELELVRVQAKVRQRADQQMQAKIPTETNPKKCVI